MCYFSAGITCKFIQVESCTLFLQRFNCPTSNSWLSTKIYQGNILGWVLCNCSPVSRLNGWVADPHRLSDQLLNLWNSRVWHIFCILVLFKILAILVCLFIFVTLKQEPKKECERVMIERRNQFRLLSYAAIASATWCLV